MAGARVRAERVLNAVAELAEDLVGDVVRELRAEVHADALRANDADDLLHALSQRRRRIVEEQMRLVEAEHELGPIEVADFGEILEELGEEPEQEARIQARL